MNISTNNTYNNIIKQLQGTRSWTKVKDSLDKISLVKTKKEGNYAIYHDNIFTGIFLNRDFVNLDELSKTNIVIQNRIME